MRKLRVCIYGGTDLHETLQDFIASLAFQILDSLPAVIVTGGFRHSNAKPTAVSTDIAALGGAQRYATEKGIDLRECFEAWIPEPSLDDRLDVKGVIRMNAGDGITLRIMSGRTPLGRRLAMVADVDIVITISGKQHTEVVVEQALDLGLPVFPIPNAGGDSKDLLDTYRGRIAAGFAAGALETCLEKVSQSMSSQTEFAAGAVVDLIKTAKVGRCLVLLPYDNEHEALYASTIEPAVSTHMIPLRLDQIPRSDAIYTSFADAIQSCSALIADITVLNKNVMYEIGYAHGSKMQPLLYTRHAERLDQLPVYFRTLNVRLASEATPISKLIDEYLTSVKAARRSGRNPLSFSPSFS